VTIINHHPLDGGVTVHCDVRDCANTFKPDVAAWMALPPDPPRPRLEI
jgi:hypothetical protein